MMSLNRPVRHSRSGERISIEVIDANEQARRIHSAIAQRAFEIFERRGTGAYEQEDWRQAESALLRPLCVGRMSLDHSLWVSMDAAHFEEGTIQIWVAPRRLTVCGKPRARRQGVTSEPDVPHPYENMMFREVGLPVEIDPSNVAAHFNGQFLEILLKQAQVMPQKAAKAAA
jgi:HSP20 family molecular chaperone IbpA